MDAVILCGGKGTRLASLVNDVPKPLAIVAGRPFLEHLLSYAVRFPRITRIIFATGHLAHKVEAHFGNCFQGIPLVYSKEDSALGTGGAIVLAMRRYTIDEPFLIFNGDSFIDADLDGLINLLEISSSLIGLSTFKVKDGGRFGTLACEDNKVVRFIEKDGANQPGIINAGIYSAQPNAFDHWQDSQGFLSLEQTILPELVRQGSVSAIETGTRFIDIGLPETYMAATDFFLSD